MRVWGSSSYQRAGGGYMQCVSARKAATPSEIAVVSIYAFCRGCGVRVAPERAFNPNIPLPAPLDPVKFHCTF